MEQKPLQPVGLDCPDRPEKEKDYRHCSGHIEVGISPAQKRTRHFEAVFALDAPAERADTRNEPKPIRGEDEDENRGKKPKSLFDEVSANDAFQKFVKTFHQPFPKILRAGGHILDFARGRLGEHNQAHRDNPGDYHGTGDRPGAFAGFWVKGTDPQSSFRQSFLRFGASRTGFGRFYGNRFCRRPCAPVQH